MIFIVFYTTQGAVSIIGIICEPLPTSKSFQLVCFQQLESYRGCIKRKAMEVLNYYLYSTIQDLLRCSYGAW